jgi:NADPH-dependent glutamate synthase beta subunit-like oxidoreductase
MGGIADRFGKIVLESVDGQGESMGERDFLEVDNLVLSAGRLPELAFVHASEKPEAEQGDVTWQTIETFRTFQNAGGLGIFSSPEPGRVSDSSAVVKSILSGRRLARAIDQHFNNEAITSIEHLTCEADYVLDVTGVQRVSPEERQGPQVSGSEGDSKSPWIFAKEVPGLDENAAKREAERCLQCGLICYEKSLTDEIAKKAA